MKKGTLKVVLSVILALLLILSVSACGQNASPAQTTNDQTKKEEPKKQEEQKKQEETKKADEKAPATVSLMTFQSWNKDGLKDIFEQIKKDENITVDLQIIPDPQLGNLIKTKIAAGEVPDLVTQNSTQYLALGQDNLLDLSNEAWVSRLSRADTVKAKDGKVIGFPLKGYSFFGGVWYNKKVFSDLGLQPGPKTYADFLKLCESIKNSGKGIAPICMSDKDEWTTQIFCASASNVAMNPNEKDIWNKVYTNKLKVTDIPEFKKSIQDFFDLYKKGYVNKDHLTTTWDMAKENLVNGKAAMVMNGDWIIGDIQSKWPDKLNDIGHFALPYADKDMVNTGSDIWCYFALAKGKNPDATKRFLNAFSQPKYINQFYAKNPCPIAAFKDADGGQVAQVVKDEAAKYLVGNQCVFEIGDLMPEAGDAYWNSFVKNLVAGSAGKKTVDQTLAEYQQKLEEIMKGKKMPGW